MFTDKEVDKKVKYKLGIFDGREPTQEDLEKVEELLLSNVNARGEVIDTDISEIAALRGLRTLDLKGFTITPEILETIKNLPELVQLKLYDCRSDIPLSISSEKLKSLILDNCGRVDLSETVLPEYVLIINGEVVDISGFVNVGKLKELDIKNSEIVNASDLKRMAKLERFNADGSTLDDDNVISELRAKKINVSNNLEYHPIK